MNLNAISTAWDLGRDITYEVLIANLGGYESAKSKLRDNGSLHAERLKKALLEYRRANNIYEVGDWVFPRAKGSGFRAMQIKKITKTFLYADHLILNVEHWRHATDAEIEAGKRLEVV